MTIRHHLSDDLLAGHAAGTLPEAFGLIVAAHVSLCDACRARLLAWEAVGGAVLEGEAVPLAEGALERSLARIGGQEPAPRRAAPGVLPAPLADYIGGDLSAVKWTTLGMGVRQAILSTSRRASATRCAAPPRRSNGGPRTASSTPSIRACPTPSSAATSRA